MHTPYVLTVEPLASVAARQSGGRSQTSRDGKRRLGTGKTVSISVPTTSKGLKARKDIRATGITKRGITKPVPKIAAAIPGTKASIRKRKAKVELIRNGLNTLTLKQGCDLLWKGSPSLFPFPAPRTRSKSSVKLVRAIGRATSLSSVLARHADHIEDDAISVPDGDEIGPLMMHPPRPFAYDVESLIALQDLRWDSDDFVGMELSAIPWLAYVRSCKEARLQGKRLQYMV